MVPAKEAIERLVEWTAPARDALDLPVAVPERNGAQRARDALEEAGSIVDVYRAQVAETGASYVG